MRQTDYVILGLLEEGPLSGYEIKKIVDIRFGFFWSESFGQIFPALRDLAGRGLIEEIPGGETGGDAAGGPAEAKGRSRKRYRLVPEGEAALRDWMASPVARESYRLELLLRMYFGHLADGQTLAGQVEAFRRKHEGEALLLDRFRRELEPLKDKDENHPHILQVIDLGLKVNRAYLDWCRETLEFLEERTRR
jgi:DNA-binding PadR family transcriptional regulator